MIISNLLLQNFRSYEERQFSFTDGVTMIVGPNGVGKTNVLESIYTLLQGKSFRDGDEQLLHYNTEWWKVVGTLDSVEREVRYMPLQPSPKQLIVNRTAKGRFTYKSQLPVVLFEPDDLQMIHGSPSARRAYLDTLLCKLDPSYRLVMNKYERALLQRNNLLKKGLSFAQLHDAVFVWDIAMAEYGAEMIKRRSKLSDQLNEHLSDIYSHIADASETLSALYQPSVTRNTQLATQLAHTLEKDVLRGFTGVGPHRDDVELLLNSKSAKQTASRGEIRSIVLALKQAEFQLLKDTLGDAPIFLLDDVFSELDETRQKALITQTKDTQKIITTTHLPRTMKRAVETLIEITRPQ